MGFTEAHFFLALYLQSTFVIRCRENCSVCLSFMCLFEEKKRQDGEKNCKGGKKKGYKQEIFIRIYDKLKLHYFGNFLSYFALI